MEPLSVSKGFAQELVSNPRLQDRLWDAFERAYADALHVRALRGETIDDGRVLKDNPRLHLCIDLLWDEFFSLDPGAKPWLEATAVGAVQLEWRRLDESRKCDFVKFLAGRCDPQRWYAAHCNLVLRVEESRYRVVKGRIIDLGPEYLAACDAAMRQLDEDA